MGHPNDDLSARDELLQELLDRQAQLTEALDRQVQLTEALAHRVAELEVGATSVAPPPGTPAGSRSALRPVGDAGDHVEVDDRDVVDEVDERTSRRQLLTRAATVAAGAVAGGTALAVAQATPAAAVTSFYSGNPGVDITASPDAAATIALDVHGLTAATGIRSVTQSGSAIYAAASTGIAMRAEATSATGCTRRRPPPASR
ncbi:MAG: hypothetical protein U0Q07_19915 [Acidimicrobiales bacterium]